jgi:uncharacterized protein (DUF433 family)
VGKTEVNPEEVLKAIREGMDDFAIMAKYSLSADELLDILKSMEDLGKLRTLSGISVLRDIESGFRENELRDKYRLSEKELRQIFEQADKAGLLNRARHRKVARDRITLRASAVVDAIRSGLSRTQLIRKYGLTFRGLQWICLTLVRTGLMSQHEISARMGLNFEQLVPRTDRALPRYRPDSQVFVFESGKPQIQGKVLDISQRGVRVAGIEAKVGEIKVLTVRGDELGEFYSFTFDATCRWVRKGPDGQYVAGFEISSLSIGSLAELRLLIRSVVPRSQRQQENE